LVNSRFVERNLRLILVLTLPLASQVVPSSPWGYELPFQRVAPANRSDSREWQASTDPAVARWLQTLRGEFLEVPGLLLTRDQVQRLWGLDGKMCDVVLEALVQDGFLRRTEQGGFVRRES
jgi:hypothetical protein